MPADDLAVVELPDPEYLVRRSVTDYAARGVDVRRAVPLERHAAWAVGPTRADPIAILERQAAARLPDLVPIRHGRMAASPFTFFRGAAAVMAADWRRRRPPRCRRSSAATPTSSTSGCPPPPSSSWCSRSTT